MQPPRSRSLFGPAAALLSLSLALPMPARAALTAILDRPGGALREHDPFSLVLTVGNTGAGAMGSLVLTLDRSDPDRIAILAGPAVSASLTIPAGGTAQFTWSLRAETAGPVTLTAHASGYANGAFAGTASRTESIAPKPLDVSAYPNPVSGDTLRLAMTLADDADLVTAEAYNASFERVYEGTWSDVPRANGQVTLTHLSQWTPGVYAIRVRARWAGGGERVFPLVKVLVKR